ncbi:hypothetical protein Pelo_11543 [Pelomyxa schiedti]|nr:hypothetical protein Pelo_11543 [Pelomyxa schiedti]
MASLTVGQGTDVVVDCGFKFLKVGLSGDAKPAIIPTVSACTEVSLPGCKSTWFGFEALRAPSFLRKEEADANDPFPTDLIESILTNVCETNWFGCNSRLVLTCKPTHNRSVLLPEVLEKFPVSGVSLPSDAIVARVGCSDVTLSSSQPFILADFGGSCTQVSGISGTGRLVSYNMSEPMALDSILAESVHDKLFSATVLAPEPLSPATTSVLGAPHTLRSLCEICPSPVSFHAELYKSGFYNTTQTIDTIYKLSQSPTSLFQKLPVDILERIIQHISADKHRKIGICAQSLSELGWHSCSNDVASTRLYKLHRTQVLREASPPMWGRISCESFEFHTDDTAESKRMQGWSSDSEFTVTKADKIFWGEALFHPGFCRRGGEGISQDVKTTLDTWRKYNKPVSNVIVVGGCSTVTGFIKRLEFELNLNSSTNVTVHHTAQPLQCVWKGAAATASNPATPSTWWISRSEYEEQGLGCLRSRSLLWASMGL